MRLTFSSPGDPLGSSDLVVDAEPTVSVGELAEALGVPVASVAPGQDPAVPATEVGLLVGATIPSAEPVLLPVGAVRLEVVGGPFSGEVVGLPAGSVATLGSGADQLVQILDPALLAQHATLTAARENATPAATGWGQAAPVSMIVEPSGDDAVVTVNGRRIDVPTTVTGDDLVQLGSSVLRIGRQPARNADVSPDTLGRLAYNRASRIHPAPTTPVVTLPGDKPTAAEKSPVPWLAAMLPVVIGVVMAFAFRTPVMLVMAAASPIMVIGNNVTSRRTARRTGKRTIEKWRSEVVAARAAIEAAAEEQRARGWADAPDPVAVDDIATTPTDRLWERRQGEPDALTARIGVAELPLEADYQGAGTRSSSEPFRAGVSPVPVSVDLARGVVGIAGPRAVALSIARTLVVNLAVTRSPRDLGVILLCDQASEADWAFTRWLPHVEAADGALALIGNTSDTRLARLRELGSLIEGRRAARGSRSDVRFDTDVVVVIDQARTLRTLPGMVTLLEQGPALGVHVVAIEDDRSRLPQEAVTEILVDPAAPTLGRIESATAPHARVLLDSTTAQRADRIARALAPIVHVGGVGDDNLLPASVRFAELRGIDLDDPQPIVSRWSYAPRETRAVVGASADGEFAIDLASDGPHGLVAGTTGAGKSEFLQTLVVSLALVNRPDALNFVLVDYKGGSAFADCERLPHTVGLVTNLDGRETERALESLDAELKRRERVLKDLGAKDADAAWDKDPAAAAARGLARLVLVIDEFAELKTELPDFVNGLVRIARVGRSLGVHLILATQRPAGAITPEMQSNTNLRVALRVTDRGDSTDVLGSPEAASISTSTPGRGYARRGAGASPAGFQTARVAGRRPGVQASSADAPRVVTRSWRDVGLPVVFPKRASHAGPIDHDDTDLRALVDVISSATEALGVAKNPSPWLDPLPTALDLAHPALDRSLVAGGSVILGLEDVPSEQTQRPLTWNPADNSHLEFVGGARSGRTSALRSLVAQLAEHNSPDDLHLYAIDFGNGGLGPIRDLPHTGAVVTPLESGRLPRFIRRLGDEIGRRQNLLSRGSFGDVREQRAAVPRQERLPYAVVVIDGWERLTSDLGADAMVSFRDEIVRLLREGPAVGVRLVIAGDRALINDKVSAFIDTKYLLPMTDREDYRTAGIPVRGLPAEILPGRTYFGTPLREAQFALLPGGPSGEAQSAALRAVVAAVVASVASDASATGENAGSGDTTADIGAQIRPFRVDVLPAEIGLEAAGGLPLKADGPGSGLGSGSVPRSAVVLGVGGDELSRYAVDVLENRGLIVVGDRRTGRSTTLALVATQLAAAGLPVVAVALRESPLRDAARSLGIPLITDADLAGAAFDEVIAPATSLLEGVGAVVALLIDDVETLKDTALEREVLDARARFAFLVSAHVDEAGGLFRGPFPEAKKARRGILLSASTAMHGTQTFGAPLPRSLQGQAAPGRGALFWEGGYVEVQVPLPLPLPLP